MSRALTRVLLLTGAAASVTACASNGRSGRAANDTLRMTGLGLGAAVTAPLHDFNLMREEIPPILLRARRNPYEPPERRDCESLQREIAAYDLALGPDMDIPADQGERDLYARGSEAASNAALDAVRDATTGWIPFRSVMRRLSGAEQNENDLRQAILAGTVRRSYLKGLGEVQNCPSPAAPLRPDAQVAQQSAAPAAEQPQPAPAPVQTADPAAAQPQTAPAPAQAADPAAAQSQPAPAPAQAADPAAPAPDPQAAPQ